MQLLLRFLSQEARVPLPTALSKINELRKAQLNNAEAISKSTTAELSPVFGGDEKVAKQILAAAKRVSNPKSKKRAAPTDDAGVLSSKGSRGPQNGDPPSPAELEASLALPSLAASVEELQSINIQTNRAPLLLAFAVTVLKYTMPRQPLSSRLSLAQAVVSANSRSKAVSIGLVKEGERRGAEEEGWGDGQPKVKVLGRSIAVMRRVGYNPATLEEEVNNQGDNDDSQATMVQERDNDKPGAHVADQEPRELPLWGLDLEALRKSNGPLLSPGTTTKGSRATAGLPIYSPQSARSYLLKSFTLSPPTTAMPPSDPETKPDDPSFFSFSSSSPTKKKPKLAPAALDHSTALSHLLHALDLLCASWAGTLESNELDRRAWGWYVTVRPDVATGERGWGQRGDVELSRIVGLMRWEG